MHLFSRASLLLFLLCAPCLLWGGYSRVGGTWSPERYVPNYSVQEHYDFGSQHLQQQEWDEALTNFMVIRYHFADSPFYTDALFYTAVCHYGLGAYFEANRVFDAYLELPGKLKHFEKVFEYKLEIAKLYAAGKKKPLFGWSRLPKWGSGKTDAVELFDEVIAALPGKDISAEALYCKAQLLRTKREYRESIDSLQTIARRFPKHALAAQGYVMTSEIYLDMGRLEAQNPDLISLAHVNLQRFIKSFPSDERIEEVKSNLIGMQEVYAQSLYDTARFYERKHKPHASAIYYRDAIARYPGTKAAYKSHERLMQLG